MFRCSNSCSVWNECAYQYKGMCDCVGLRKFKPKEPEKEVLSEEEYKNAIRSILKLTEHLRKE